jgi:ATP-dependent DNA ligase
MISEVFKQLVATSKRTEKERILRAYDSETLRKVFEYTLNPYKVFYLKKIPADVVHTGTAKIEDAFPMLDDLATKKYRGHAAQNHFLKIYSALSAEEASVLRRILMKDPDCGVQTSTVNKIWDGLVPTFNIQLAESFNKNTTETIDGWVEPKIDGFRATIFINGPTPEEVVAYSRSGKEFESLDQVKEQLVRVFPVGSVVDGEVGVGDDFQENASVVGRKKNINREAIVEFTIFDLITVDEFKAQRCDRLLNDRLETLNGFMERADSSARRHLKLNPCKRVNSVEEVLDAYGEYIDNDYEGAMYKKNAPYVFDRSDNWQKVKPTETADVEIVGWQEGTGKNVGKLGAFFVLFNGVRTRVGGGFKESAKRRERTDFWQNKEKMIGDIIEVVYTGVTNDGKLRHSRFKKLRTYKGEKF